MTLTLTREEAFQQLTDAYSVYFDVEPVEEHEAPLIGKFHFNARSAKYVLIKKAELWHADSNEHIYLFSMPELTADLYRSCEKLAYDQGMALIDPKPGHMYTYITAVFLCDTCTDEAKKLLRRCRLYKSFHFSLHGWMDFHTVLLERGSDKIITNRSGKANAKLMKNIFMKKKKRKGECNS